MLAFNMRSSVRGVLSLLTLAICLHLLRYKHLTDSALWRRPWLLPDLDSHPPTDEEHIALRFSIGDEALLNKSTPIFPYSDGQDLKCLDLPGSSSVAYIIKTGSTELEERLPIHLRTTLRCWQHTLILSDMSETFTTLTIHDTLSDISEQIRLSSPQFELWRRLHEHGRAALGQSELSSYTRNEEDVDAKAGHKEIAGWGLDKFKFLPMIGKSLRMIDEEVQWFVFAETDTYVSTRNLLTWVAAMDPREAVYLGSQAIIGEQQFGHGGSGVILSRRAMEMVREEYEADQAFWDFFTSEHWAGDCVLATVLQKKGVRVTWGFPILQGGDPMRMDFREVGYQRKLWCYPAVSYHHIGAETVERLWEMDDRWDGEEPLRHRDVFWKMVLPILEQAERMDWDNAADESLEDVSDKYRCQQKCEERPGCLQFSFVAGRCRVSEKMIAGGPKKGVMSGWMVDRIHRLIEDFDHCEGEGDWILP